MKALAEAEAEPDDEPSPAESERPSDGEEPKPDDLPGLELVGEHEQEPASGKTRPWVRLRFFGHRKLQSSLRFLRGSPCGEPGN